VGAVDFVSEEPCWVDGRSVVVVDYADGDGVECAGSSQRNRG
jgi:hypothetical protein